MGTNLLVGLALAVPIGAPALKPAAGLPVPPTLLGVWAVESYVEDGQARECVGLTFEFAANNRLVLRKDGMEGDDDMAYSTAPGKDPPEFDWADPDGTNRLPGIYQFDGDTLLICFRGDPTGTRPTMFAAPPGSESVLFTLKRAKKKD